LGVVNRLPLDDNGSWSDASIRIFGETLQPEEIGAALGLKATRTHSKGQPRSPRFKAVWRESFWSLQSPLGKDRDLASHLRWLLDTLEPKLTVIRSLSEKYQVNLFCGLISGNGEGGFTLDSTTLARIAKLGVPLVVDLYPPIVDEEAEVGKWSAAGVRVFGEMLQPAEIEGALGLRATRTHLKGQPRGRNDAVWGESFWSLQSPPREDHNLADHLRWIFDRLEPRLDIIRTLSAKYRVDLFCSFSSACGQGGFKLDGITVARLANLGVPLVVNLYPPGPVEIEGG
jgi:uncharacterized protein DUF4279